LQKTLKDTKNSANLVSNQKRLIYLQKKRIVMMIISAREFRENQTKVLNAAINGQSIILTSRIGNFKIIPVSDSDQILENNLRSACAEVKAHMLGDVKLPLAQDIVF